MRILPDLHTLFSETTTVAVPPGSTAAPAVPGTTGVAGTTGKL